MQMKKIYSLLLAAGIAATATAAPRTFELSKDSQTYTPLATEKAVIEKGSAFRAPSKAEADLPQSLEGKKGLMNFVIVEKDQQTGQQVSMPVSSVVSFSDEQEEDGLKYYSMTSFLAPHYNVPAIEFHSVSVGYDAEYGVLYLVGDQNYLTYQGMEFNLWAVASDNSCVPADYPLAYENGTFTLVNPFPVRFQTGTQDFNAARFILGTVLDNSVQSVISLGNEFSITLIDDIGEMTYVMTTNQGAQNMEDEVGVSVNGSTVTIYNFAGLGNVPMEINTTDKTLTATNVQLTNITKYKAFLSEADAEQENAAGTKKYVLKSTYDVANGKTTISVPDWNAFYYSFGADNAYCWPMSNTEINFDIDLEALANAGVEGIAADAEFDANAPVEYFNLQGIRVATPEAGQFLIKRQGKKVEKVVVR